MEFQIGRVLNPIPVRTPGAPRRSVTLSCGGRLSSMSLDSSKIVPKNAMVYTAGEIVIAIDIGVTVQVERLDEPDRIDVVEGPTSRPLLVRHAVGLMRAALGTNHGLRIRITVRYHLPHCGLGSSSLVVAAVAIAINELYGCPIADDVLARYVAQNHGEEIGGDDQRLVSVQCLGGSGAANLFPGALLILAGETTLIGSMTISDAYQVVIGVPRDHHTEGLDAAILMQAEAEQASGFALTGQTYAPRVAYELVHEGLPGMARGDLTGIGRIIYQHRFLWGSINNCRFSHPRLLQIADGVRYLWEQQVAPIVGLSSAGPAFYAITTQVEACRRVFEQNNLEVFTVPLFNGTYKVLATEEA